MLSLLILPSSEVAVQKLAIDSTMQQTFQEGRWWSSGDSEEARYSNNKQAMD